MKSQGLNLDEIKKQFYFIDEYGLITKSRKYVNCNFVKNFARYFIVLFFKIIYFFFNLIINREELLFEAKSGD